MRSALATALALGLAMAPLLALPLAGEAQPDGGGCTPCECRAAYCQGDRVYWPVIDAIEAPATVAPGQPFEVRWHVELVDREHPDDRVVNGTWGTFGGRLQVAPTPFGNASDALADVPPGTWQTSPGPGLRIPGWYNATLELPEGTWHLRPALVEVHALGPSVQVDARPQQDPATPSGDPATSGLSSSPSGTDPARGAPGASPVLALPLALAALALSLRGRPRLPGRTT